MTNKVKKIQLAIIGGGPAGMSAAITASNNDIETFLFDENTSPGGQIYRNSKEKNNIKEKIFDKDYFLGNNLIKEFEKSNCNYFNNSSVWFLSKEGDIGVIINNKSLYYKADTIIIASGTIERSVPYKGWNLPGVMSAGSAQILLKSSGTIPKEPPVLIGNGPLLLLLACQLARANIKPKAILDMTPYSSYLKALPFLPNALIKSTEIWKGFQIINEIRKHKIRVIRNVKNIELDGNEKLEKITYWRNNKKYNLESKIAFMHFGVIPNIIIPQSVSIKHEWNMDQLCWQPIRDIWGNTNQDKYKICGDNSKIMGVEASKISGNLVAFNILEKFGKISKFQKEISTKKIIKTYKKIISGRRFIDILFKPREDFIDLNQNLTVCRCENVSLNKIKEAIKNGAFGPNQIKTFTRVGMGNCQGRQCSNSLTLILKKLLNKKESDIGILRARPPLKYVTLKNLSE